MFCSNCGKTIRPEDDACRHCGASLGEGRFYGNTYTSSQVRLPVEALNEAPEGGMISYTRTSYMSYDNQPEDDVYSNTTYRPLLSEEEDLALAEAEQARLEAEAEAARIAEEEAEAARIAEEEAAKAAEAAEAEQAAAEAEPEEADPPTLHRAKHAAPEEEPAEEEPEEEPIEDIPEESTSPLPDLERPAISQRVLGYMEELDLREQRRANSKLNNLRMPAFLNKLKKGQPAAEEELPEAEDIPTEEEAGYEAGYAEETEAYQAEAGAFEDELPAEEEAAPAEEEWAEAPAEEEWAETAAEGEADEYVAAEGEDDFAAYEDADYAEEEENEKPGFSLSRLLPNVDIKALLQNRILHIAAAAVLIIAVIIAGSIWLSFVTAKRAKIADVTYSAYSQGIELLTAHTTEEYRDEMVETYIVNTSYANTAFDEQMQALNDLIPEEPLSNDELFVNTLTNIQNAIAEAIKADANAELNGLSAERAADSERDWQAIQDAINKLSETVNAGELLSIVSNLDSIVAPTPSPSPTPAGPRYETLENGMMDSAPVQKMQNRLINLGFLDGDADGDFGNGTEAAVRAFQRAAGLPDDGIATAEVQEAMYAENAPRIDPSPEATDEPESEPVG